MNRNIEELLDRYLKRESSEQENQLIEKWLEENSIADPAWQRLSRENKDQWLSEVFSDVKTTILSDEPVVKPLMPGRYLWYKLAGVAAVLLMIFSLYFFWPLWKRPVSAPELSSVSAPNLQKRQITLSDGTRIWLNTGAELKYPKRFGSGSRTVYLSGEAYFDVQHDAEKPFIIHTGEIVTTVLGTAFNIKENQDQHTLEVTVTRGKVSVAEGNKLLSILTPDQQVNIDLLTGKFRKNTVNADDVIAWQSTEMFFDDVTFAAAAAQLEKHFHVSIRFDNEKLKTCRFSGSTMKGDRLEKILDVIAGFNNASWKKHPNGNIIIYGQGCN